MVLLVSEDGQAFTVPRDIATRSIVIRNMLEGKDQNSSRSSLTFADNDLQRRWRPRHAHPSAKRESQDTAKGKCTHKSPNGSKHLSDPKP